MCSFWLRISCSIVILVDMFSFFKYLTYFIYLFDSECFSFVVLLSFMCSVISDVFSNVTVALHCVA